MSKGIFVTATGTDIGKTFVTALIIKKLRDAGLNAGYYKAVLSGADCIDESDAGYVNRIAKIGQDESTLLSYLYKSAVSPHLASRIEGNPVEMQKIIRDFDRVKSNYNYVTVEGSGGIVCPICYDETTHIFLEDIIKALNLNTLLIADAGLGSINYVVLTVEYMRARNIRVKGIILNHFHPGNVMEEDNLKMCECLTGLKVLACVKEGDRQLDIDAGLLASLYE